MPNRSTHRAPTSMRHAKCVRPTTARYGVLLRPRVAYTPRMNPSRHASLARPSALALRPNGRRITPLDNADPTRDARFTATLDDLTLDDAKPCIEDAARDALFALPGRPINGFRRPHLADGAALSRRYWRGGTGEAVLGEAVPVRRCRRSGASDAVNITGHSAAMHMAPRGEA